MRIRNNRDKMNSNLGQRDKSVKHFGKSESFTKKKGEKIMTKRFGFTLAEVLITLGIIGVVAAMTMPTLMNSTQGAQYKAAYKKALSALSQAVTLNVALDEVDFGDINETSSTTISSMLRSRMNVVRAAGVDGEAALATAEYSINPGIDGDKHGVAVGENNVTLFMNDGIMFQYNPTTAYNCTKDTTVNNGGWEAGSTNMGNCSGFIDVNGTKGPNKVVACDANSTTTCTVTNPTDIYPVYFFDTSVLPSTDAARAVLYGK